MSLRSRLLDLATAIGTDVKQIQTDMPKIEILEVGESLPDPLPEGVIFFQKE